MDGIFIGNTQYLDWYGAGLADRFGHDTTQTAIHTVFFYRKDTSRFPGSTDNGIRICGLQRMHIDDTGTDAFGCQTFAGFVGMVNRFTTGNDGQILTVLQLDGLAYFVGKVVIFVNIGYGIASYTYINRMRMGTYVVFDCIGEDEDCIGETWEKFYKEFLPQMGYEAESETDYEIYFEKGREGLMCELWIPIRKK